MPEVPSFKPSRRRLRVHEVAALLLTCWGCREELPKEAVQRAESVASSTKLPEGPGPLTESGLAGALVALKERVGKSPAILAVELTLGQAMFQIESSSEPRKLEQYEWRDNRLSGPFPLEVRGSGAVEQNLFSYSGVDWTCIPGLANTARTQVDADHGQVSKVLIRRNLPQDEAVVIRVYVESPARSGHVDADWRGKLLDAPRTP